MSVRLGINPITWSNDDMPELGGDIPLETCLAETRQAGYSGTELGGKFPRTSQVLGPILAQHHLHLVSGWFSGLAHERDVAEEFAAMQPHLTLLRELACQHVVYADTSGRQGFPPISQRPRLADDDWRSYGRKLTELAERMAAFGVRMAFHHHMGTIVESEADIDRLMAATGEAVGLLFDSGHCLFAGGDPLGVLSRHIGRVVHVHCKDVRENILRRVIGEDMTFLEAILAGVFTVPGDGGIAFVPLLRLLCDAGYAGWLVVEAEQDPRQAHPLTYAQLGYRNLRAMAVAAGFAVE
jgi:inosose dehydratase